jgi:hypothetical protein
VALLHPWTVIVECKSAFVRRAHLLQPVLAVLLIDTVSVTLDGTIRRLNRLLLAEPMQEQLAPLPSLQGVWGTTSLYVTSVSQSLDASLKQVLQAIEQKRIPLG